MKRIGSTLILLLCLWNVYAVEYTVETVPNDHLKNGRDYVTDPDRIISEEAEQTINDLIASTEQYATAEVAVVLLSSIGYDDIDDFGTRLFTHWGIGKDKKDNGLLFLLVYDQREMIFRTGYGLEGVLPDVILSRIIRNDISPRLKEGDFDAGVIAGITKVCEYLKNPETLQEIMQKEKEQEVADRTTWIQGYLVVSLIVFLLFLLMIVLILKSKSTNYNKYLSLNKWKVMVIFSTVFFPVLMIFYLIFYFAMRGRMRNKPIACNNCGHKMHKLSEKEEDTYLNPAQQAEENVQSIDYDVWLCDNCKNREVLPYSKNSRYSYCPNCQAKTYYLSGDQVVKRATSFHTGQGQKTYLCKNCGKKDLITYIIPMIIIASGGSSGRSGGFGGGGGGSWGGGSTGGGGARGGW